MEQEEEYEPLTVDIDGKTFDLGYVNTYAYITVWTFVPSAKTSGGIIIPEMMREKSDIRLGKVVAIGENCFLREQGFRRPMCRLGDWVLYRRYENQTYIVGARDENGRPDFHLFGNFLCDMIVQNFGPNPDFELIQTQSRTER
jgi:co-chaperonin GroES (HSP10)